jgi:hypothetical protein
MIPDLLETEGSKQEKLDDVCDNFGFAETDIQEANGHKDDANSYIQDVEKLIEDFENAEDNKAAEEAADECDEA